jgi:hypothetical protein
MFNSWQENRVDCYIKRGLDTWEPAHLSQVKQGDVFQLLDQDGMHEAYEDAYFTEDGWKVKAAWYKEGQVKTT